MSAVAKPIIVVGSINMDLVVTARRLPTAGETLIGDTFATYHGGKGANQAVAVARLGHSVEMVGAVGSDAFGEQLRGGLAAAGVGVDMVETVEGPSGIAAIATGDAGENSIVVVPGANAAVTPERLEALEPRLAEASMLLAQLEIAIECIEWLAAFAERHGIPLMLDPAPARDVSQAILSRVTWLTPNESETAALIGSEDNGDAAALLLASGARNIVLKRGAAGCVVARVGEPDIRLPAAAVTAVDTTAAGDAFNAGLAVALTRGDSVEAAARFATIVAGLSVTKRGAQPSMPSAEDVRDFAASAAAGAAA